MYRDELCHFGIKGMKWGIRRYQNSDGTLTNAGKKRYSDCPRQKQKNKYKTEHRLNLEKKYMEKGLSKEEAEIAADKRIKTEKYVALAAGVTVAACAAAYTYNKYAVDKVLSNNTDFQRIMRLNVGEAIKPGRSYVAYTKSDKVKYKGMLGKDFMDRNIFAGPFDEKDIQKVKIKFHDDVKIASPKRARSTFQKMYENNKEFRDAVNQSNKEFDEAFNGWGKQGKLFKEVINQKKSKFNMYTKGYDAFNVGLANNSESGKKAANMFYDELRKQGVNAVQDLNDKKYSGYKSDNPLIVFGGKFDYKGDKMSEREIRDNLKKAQDDIIRKELTEAGVKLGAAGVGAYGASRAVYKATVNSYRKQHPDTTLSDKEIYKLMVKESVTRQK